jgi:hypothetical protein
MSSVRVLTFHDWERIQESERMYLGQPLNEEWTLSDILHTIGDVVSASSDCIWPGSGSVVDIIQAITYFLEASNTEDYVESASASIAGIVSLASLALIGPMQTLAMEAKGLLKVVKEGVSKGASKLQISAAKTASTKLIKFLQGIVSSASTLSSKIVGLVKNAAETKLGAWVIQKFGTTEGFVTWINKFFKETVINNLNKFIGYLGKLNPAAAAGSIDDVTIQKFGKQYASGSAQDTVGNKILTKGNSQVKLSGISPTIKYEVKRKFLSPDQEFQRDTTHDLKPMAPLQVKRNA